MQVYQDLCSKDGLSLNEPSAHGSREYSLSLMPGAYRRLLVRPADLSWQLLRYSNADAPLAVTALDRACSGKQNAEAQLACSIIEPGECLLPIRDGIGLHANSSVEIADSTQMPLCASHTTVMYTDQSKKLHINWRRGMHVGILSICGRA